MTPEVVAEGVWRLEVPSRTMPPFTTTNSYLVEDAGVGVLIDPGFEDRRSLEAVAGALDSLGVRLLKATLLTHTHGDHIAGLRLLREEFGEQAVYVHPLELSRLENVPGLAGMNDERVLTVGSVTVKALHTPGHSPGHLCFHLPEAATLLTGDLVAGHGSVWVGVPEGDVSAYLHSLDRVAGIPGLQRLGPGHGPLVDEPYGRLAASGEHRLRREEEVLLALASPLSLSELRLAIYPELAEPLQGPAEASLLAHLRKLMAEMRVVHLGEDYSGPFVARA